MECKDDLYVKTLLFKAGKKIKQNDAVPGKTHDIRELLVYLH